MWVGVTHFLCYKCLVCYKSEKVHFAAHFAVFCGRLSSAKAVPLHRISKRAETTKTTKNYARNYEPTYLPTAQPKHKGRV